MRGPADTDRRAGRSGSRRKQAETEAGAAHVVVLAGVGGVVLDEGREARHQLPVGLYIHIHTYYTHVHTYILTACGRFMASFSVAQVFGDSSAGTYITVYSPDITIQYKYI